MFLVLTLGAAASTWDIRERRIPNALSLGALAVALFAAVLDGGWPALVHAAEGAAVFGGPLVLFWAFGWLGAGDAKLGFALGAFLGMPLALTGLVYGALAGGVFGLLYVAWSLARRAPALVGAFRRYGVLAHVAVGADPAWGASMPYGVFLSVGAVAARALVLAAGR